MYKMPSQTQRIQRFFGEDILVYILFFVFLLLLLILCLFLFLFLLFLLTVLVLVFFCHSLSTPFAFSIYRVKPFIHSSKLLPYLQIQKRYGKILGG